MSAAVSAGVSARLLKVAGRLGWGVADQAVSSLGNFALGIYVARTFGADAFGAFTLAVVSSSVVLNAARGMATDPLLVRHSGPADTAWRHAVAAATGTALLVGVVCGILSAATGLLCGDSVGPAFLALALVLPPLMLMDSWRFAFFSCGRGREAFAIDLTWLVAVAGALVVLHHTGRGGVVATLLTWAGAVTLAAAVAVLRGGVRPRLDATGAWVRRHRDLAGRYLAENVTFSGASQLRAVLLGAVASLAAVGQLRAAEILMGPFVVVLMGISQVAVPEASRVLGSAGPVRLQRFCFAMGSVQAIAAAAWGIAVVLALPLGLGELLLGDLWRPAAALLPAAMITVVGSCFTTGAGAGLRALGAASRSLRAQLYASAVYLVGGAGGAVLAGAAGAAWGSAGATVIAALLWWWQLRVAAGEQVAVLGGGRPAPESESDRPEPVDAMSSPQGDQ